MTTALHPFITGIRLLNVTSHMLMPNCMRWRAASALFMTSEKEIAITKAKIIHFLHSLSIPIMSSSIPTLTSKNTSQSLHNSIHFPFIHIK